MPPLLQRLSPPLTALGMALAVAWPARGQAQETVIVGELNEPAVEVNLGVLDSLAPAPANPYPTLDAQAMSSNQGSVLLIAPTDAYAPSLVAPDSDSDTFTLPAGAEASPLPEAPSGDDGVLAPEVVETTTVVEEIATEETMVEEVVTEDAEPTELVATTAASDLDGNDGDSFAEIEDMLSAAEQTDEVVVPAPETTVEETVVATTAAEEPIGATLHILFEPGAEALTDGDKSELRALAGDLTADEGQRVQLRAYASAQGGTSSMARRLALSRALEVRKFLIANGVRSIRIDVRALGDTAESGPLDRIDIVLVDH